MFERFKRDIRAQKFFSTAEEAMFFEQAAREVAAGEIQAGLHAMALSKCEGDEVKANAMYLQLRVDMLKQEAAVGEKILEAAEREEERARREEAHRDLETKRASMWDHNKPTPQKFEEEDDSGRWILLWGILLLVALAAIAVGVATTQPN